jgi:hypothetical protein
MRLVVRPNVIQILCHSETIRLHFSSVPFCKTHGPTKRKKKGDRIYDLFEIWCQVLRDLGDTKCVLRADTSATNFRFRQSLDLYGHERLLATVPSFFFEPVFAKEFNRVLGTDGSAAAAEVVGGTIQIASPADTFGMLRMRGYLRHAFIVPRRRSRGCDFRHKSAPKFAKAIERPRLAWWG